MRQKASALADMPRAFPLVPRFERLGIRRRVHGKYLILYMVTDDMITIVRIVHAARNYGRLLLPEE